MEVAKHLPGFRTFPAMIGECGGKNYHFVHNSADVRHVAVGTIRSAFEYGGQKCSACSRWVLKIIELFYAHFWHILFTLTVRLVMTFDLQSIFPSLKMGIYQIWTFINPLSINNGWSFWFFDFLISCYWRKIIWPNFKLHWCCQGWSILHHFGWRKLWQVKR